MKNTEEFKVKSGKMVLSDPCYDRGTWCQGIIDNVKNGTWITEIEYKGDRVARLMARHESVDYLYDSHDVVNRGRLMDFDGGVDSGQFGYFDDSDYLNDEPVKDVKVDLVGFDSHDQFYKVCCDKTLSESQWGVLPGGVVTSSGYGDGSYPTYGMKNNDGEYVAFTTIFISDEDEEDDEMVIFTRLQRNNYKKRWNNLHNR